MRYKTGDLSKILNVASNTIRRYEEKGYLTPMREASNGYRYFDSDDVAKMVFISKYRKIGFSHDEIGQILQTDLNNVVELCQDKMAELDEQIATLTAVRHMLKDDVVMMKRVEEYGSDIMERPCVPFYYVSYQKNGKLLSSGKRGEKLYDFMYKCPEIKYCYIFRKENILNRRLVYEEAIAIKQKDSVKFNIAVDSDCVVAYDAKPSIMRMIKLPLDFTNEYEISNDEACEILFDNLLKYMDQNGYKCAGDAIVIRIALSKEKLRDWQYMLISIPYENK